MKASILKIEKGCVYSLAAPSLPKGYTKAIEGSAIGENTGSCGTAAFKNETVIVSDVQNDPRWENYKHFGSKYNFNSCWSIPITNRTGEVIATFANYYQDSRKPTEKELNTIERAQQLITLLFEKFNHLERLKRSNERFQHVNRATNDAIYDWDVAQDNIDWGKSFERIFGHSVDKSKFTVDDWFNKIHRDDLKSIKKDFEQFINNPKQTLWKAYYRFQRKDGTYAHVEEIGSIIRKKDGHAKRMIGVIRDISEIKLAQQEIETSNEHFKNVVKATNDAIWDWDIKSNSFYYGIGYKTLFGIDIEKEEKNFDTWKSRIHPDDFEQLMENVNTVLYNPDISNFESSYRFLKNSGEYAYVTDRGVIMRDEDGNAIRLIGAIKDVSQQKEYEASLQQLNKDLEEHAKELAVSNAELEQFAYVASHDLQEPLRMITSFMARLDKKYSHLLDEKGKRYIYFAVDGAERMRQIILDLLEYSRVGKHEDKLKAINLNDLIEEIKTLFKKLIEEKNAEITYDNLPVISFYKTPLLQVVQNLINNALKYTKNEIPPKIHISVETGRNEYTFAIRDNGIGIEEAYLEKIFVIFQRLHTKEAYSGTGMGLAIVKKIIENLGGKIWVTSTPGEGSAFYFTIKKLNKQP